MLVIRYYDFFFLLNMMVEVLKGDCIWRVEQGFPFRPIEYD